MSPSSVSSKSIVFLLGLLYLEAYAVDAVISTSAGFPQDVFAKPAFQVHLGGMFKDAATLPIKRSDAIRILEQQESCSSFHSRDTCQSSSHSLAVPGQPQSQPSYPQQQGGAKTLFWSLERCSPTEFQLCSIPDFTLTPADKQPLTPHHGSASSSRSKQQVIRNAQTLLEPLKQVCLYHTTDWFTYSFCHGREIRQFRRLSPQIAAQKAFKKAGGGDAGKKAALEAAEKVNSFVHPIADPEYPAFILGRWTPQSEEIVADHNTQHHPQQHGSLETEENGQVSKGLAVSSNPSMPSLVNSAGLDLVEEVQFGDWDQEELFAAEAKALSSFNPQESLVESSGNLGLNSERHRYLTQRWTNGTMCDMNHQPRTVQVQFHCSNRKPLEDRIVMFKETTICNYVLVIETPRLCGDAAFASEKEEKPWSIECHTVVDDAFGGKTVSDPDKVMLGEIQGNHASSESTEKGIGEVKEETKSAKEASSTSHTYGDLSRYGSVHDDYFDEALGGHGALYHQYHHDHHDHDQEQGHDDVLEDDIEEAEIMVEVSMNQDGTLQVEKVDPPTSSEAKEVRRRESGKKRSDDPPTQTDSEGEEQGLEIQLDMDDFLSVLRGEGEDLESKLAEKISKVLSSKMNNEQTFDNSEMDQPEKAKGKEKGKTPEQVAKLYKKLMTGVTGQKESKTKQLGKGTAGKQPPPLRMEKVGDSLSERVKRFYEAKERQQGDEKQKGEGKKEAVPQVEQHLEL